LTKVAIIGAGPAGASAGYHLASSGHAVTLIDRADFPRDKTCGDWITQGAVQGLAMMGLYPPRLERLAHQHAVIDTSLLASPNGNHSLAKHSMKAYCIPRAIFDDILYRRAVDAGCSTMLRQIRDLRPGQRDFLDGFDTIIDARGVYAGAPNCVALRTYWTLELGDVDPSLRSTVHIYSDDVYRMGYGWIFPVQIGSETIRFNIGAGVWKAECREPKKTVTDYFNRFISDNPTARRLSDYAVEKTPPRGHHLAVAEKRNRVAGDGILRIGDAANLTDPLTGEGIGNAILSGFLVAQAINMSPDAAAAGPIWQKLYESTFERDFRVALSIRKLLVDSRAKNAAMWLLKRRPRLAASFHASLAGTARYSDLLSLSPWRR
jgi:flavin-dependent dehydrogenase